MIIFLYGEDTFRSRKKLKELKNRFLKEIDSSGYSLAVIDGEKTCLEEINSAVSALSLFTKKRMIVISDIFGLMVKKCW